jgi:hypothetical protein
MFCDHLSLDTSRSTGNNSSDDDNKKCKHVSKDSVNVKKFEKKLKSDTPEINCMVYIQTKCFSF